MKAKLILTLLIFFAVMHGATALEATLTPADNIISVGEAATFELTVTNEDDVAQTYPLGLTISDTTAWIISPSSVTVQPGETLERTIRLSPRQGIRSGSYFLTVLIRGPEQEIELNAPISVGEQPERGFVPNVGLNVEHPETLDPREELDVNIEVNNRNRLDYETITIVAESQFFYNEFNISLDGRTRESRSIYNSLPDSTPPGEYELRVRIIDGFDGETIARSTSNFIVQDYAETTTQQSTESSLFKTTTTITLENEGNIPAETTQYVNANWFERIFISSDDNYDVVQRAGEAQLAFPVQIGSFDTATVTYTENYRPLVITIIVLAALTAAYYALRSPIRIEKEVHLEESLGDGPDTVRVKIYIRNRSTKPVYSVRITDKLPSILDYDSTEKAGYLSPSKVRQKAKSTTTLHWDLAQVEPVEERILVYEATPRIDVLGRVKLLPTTAKFEDHKGRIRNTKSRTATVGHDDTELNKA